MALGIAWTEEEPVLQILSPILLCLYFNSVKMNSSSINKVFIKPLEGL